MEKATSKPKNIHSPLAELKKKLGLDKCTVIHKPIKVKKDGKHLYQVAGYFYPLRPETIERLQIPNQRILYEVDRAKWLEEMNEAKERENNGEVIDPELYPFGYKG